MAIVDLFSRRQKLERGEYPDVYQYDYLPYSFRVQVWHIVCDALGKNVYPDHSVDIVHHYVADILKREHGLLELSSRPVVPETAVSEFFFQDPSVDRALDVIELYFRQIASILTDRQYQITTVCRILSPKAAIEDLNQRFRENGIGYQFEAGRLIRLDSAYLHAEAVKPALGVLSDPRFKGANEEFLAAHAHYREGRNKECLVDCLKAFESTMKSICTSRSWTFSSTDNAKTMIGTCIANGLIPPYLESKMSALRSLLESGIPTVRNRNGGHGQGAAPVAVPDYLTRYALNLTATTILFLAELDAEAT